MLGMSGYLYGARGSTAVTAACSLPILVFGAERESNGNARLKAAQS